MSKLLFVGGFPGGGTDLVKTILNAHPLVYLNGEMPFLIRLLARDYPQAFSDLTELETFQRELKKVDNWGNIENVNYDFSTILAEQSQISLESVLEICFSNRERQVWGNKTPQNTEVLANLYDVFPHAHFLIVVRDVRDICLSWQRKWGKDVLWCAHKWATRMKKGAESAKKLPSNQVLFIHYEDLLLQTEDVCRAICDFLELPFSGRMLEHHKYTKERLDGKLNYGRSIIQSNVDKWRTQLDPRLVRRVEEIAYHTMQYYKYEPAIAWGHKPLTRSEQLTGAAKDMYALIAVGNRARNNNTLLMRVRDIAHEFHKTLAK